MSYRAYKYIIPAFLAAMLLFSTGSAESAKETGTMTVIALGDQTIYKNNAPAAKTAAVSKALKTAVERVVTELLSRSDITENLGFLYDSIFINNKDYVETYKVLTEVEKNQQFIVAVETKINTQALKTFFADHMLMNRKKNGPGILLLITEQAPGDLLPRYWWGNNPIPYESAAEEAVIQTLKNKGFQIIGHDDPRPAPEDYGISFEFIHDATAALKLAAELKADIVVIGRATAQESANKMGDERSYTASIGIEVYDIISGNTFSTLEAEGTAAGSIPAIVARTALFEAGNAAAKKLESEITKHWSESSDAVQTIATRIEGNDYLSSFIMLRKILNNMEGIEDILTRELGSEQAVVDIIYHGSPKMLANALMLKTFDSFGIELSDITETSLTIRFITSEDGQPVKSSEIEGAYISE